jgi:hypothetical protein
MLRVGSVVSSPVGASMVRTEFQHAYGIPAAHTPVFFHATLGAEK